jgi:hypothetical protein
VITNISAIVTLFLNSSLLWANLAVDGGGTFFSKPVPVGLPRTFSGTETYTFNEQVLFFANAGGTPYVRFAGVGTVGNFSNNVTVAGYYVNVP